MPNSKNINSPITLLGTGRSGTTLLSEAFSRHPDFQNCGESGGLIFSIWEGSKDTFMPLEQKDWHVADSNIDKAVHYIHLSLIASAPSEKPYWFHKPAGLPFMFLDWGKLPGERSASGLPVEWYWTVLQYTFPMAKFLTIVRNPFDVALSRMQYSAWNVEETLDSIERTYEIYDYGWINFKIVIPFEEFVSNFSLWIKDICVACEVEFRASMLASISENHAAAPNRGPLRSHRNSWSYFDGVRISARKRRRFEDIWEKLGKKLEWPQGIIFER